MRRSLLLAGVVVGLLSLLVCLYELAAYLGVLPRWHATQTAQLAADSLPPGLPPAPVGYANNAAVLAAIGAKQLQLIETKVATPPDLTEAKEVEYGRVGNRPLRLDLYQPAWRTGKPVPALIFIHGGAWSGGAKEIYKLYAVRYARRGYVTATISYRLSGEAPFPAAVEDAKCAVRWLRTHAGRYGVDPNQIGVIGGSAGGHLAMMVGYSPPSAFDRSGGSTNVSSRVAAVVDFYGPFDLTTDFARNHPSVRQFLAGQTFAAAPELYAAASPAHYLQTGAPPTLIIHGTIDDTVPVSQADKLAFRLRALGVPFIYDRLAGWPHSLDAAQPVHDRCDVLLWTFLQRYLPLPE